MIRTQIQLTEEQSSNLKKLSIEEGKSVAELIRSAVTVFLQSRTVISTEEKRKRAVAVIGRFSCNEKDLSLNHDKYLAEAYSNDIC